MKKQKIFILITVIATLITASPFAFAEQTTKVSENTISNKADQTKEKFDPIKRLENRKAEIQKSVKEGKLTQQEADEKVNRINQKISEIQAFNKLSVPEKRNKLINNLTLKLNERVKEGKMTQPEADKILGEFKAAIEKWDGTGHPPFHMKRAKGSEDKSDKHKHDKN